MSEAKWYCLRVKTRQEQSVVNRLDQQGIPTYLPLVWADRRQARRDGLAVVPMLPGYCFFEKVNGLEFRDVFLNPGVLDILRLTFTEEGDRQPTPMDEDVLIMQELEGEQGIREVKHDYEPGEEVRVKSGVFKDLEAIVHMTERDRVDAWLWFLGKKQKVRFKRHEVEPISV